MSQSYISRTNSPAAKDQKSVLTDRRNQPPTSVINSAKKRSVSKTRKSALEVDADDH